MFSTGVELDETIIDDIAERAQFNNGAGGEERGEGEGPQVLLVKLDDTADVSDPSTYRSQTTVTPQTPLSRSAISEASGDSPCPSGTTKNVTFEGPTTTFMHQSPNIFLVSLPFALCSSRSWQTSITKSKISFISHPSFRSDHWAV